MKQHMIRLGYHWVEDFKYKQIRTKWYQQDCILHGGTVGPLCVICISFGCYTLQQTPNPEPQKLKWWYWKKHCLAFDVP